MHIVNNGASRPATLAGLPAGVQELRSCLTDSRRGMQEGRRIPAADGKAEFALDALSYTTVMAVAAR